MTTKAMTRLAVILVTLCIGLSTSALKAGESNLPKRDGNRPQTTNSVPHVQIGVSPNPAINEAFLLEVSKLPGVEIRPTVVSLPGAKGFWLNEKLTLAHPEVIVGGREFAHIHPDGSLHASLPPVRAKEAVKAGWAVPHPWANHRQGWEGFVMLYTPQSKEESKITFQLIVDSYNFVTGRKN
jgi:hypothetical protein